MSILYFCCGGLVYFLVALWAYDFFGRTPTGFVVAVTWFVSLPIAVLINLWDDIKSP